MIIVAEYGSIRFRKAEESDCELVLKFIKELAKLEKSENKVINTVSNLKRYGFGKEAFFKVLILEYEHKPAGFALYYNRYSTWVGKTIEIEDIFVEPPYRKKGIGTKVFGFIAKEAIETGCSRLEWQVYHQEMPKAVSFYEKLGTHFEKGIWRCQLNGTNKIEMLINFSRIQDVV